MEGSPRIRARNFVQQDGGGSSASTFKLSHVSRTGLLVVVVVVVVVVPLDVGEGASGSSSLIVISFSSGSSFNYKQDTIYIIL